MTEQPNKFVVVTTQQEDGWEGRRASHDGQFARIVQVKLVLTDTNSPQTKSGTSSENRDTTEFGKNPPGFTPGGV